jgi:hypothetical protein
LSLVRGSRPSDEGRSSRATQTFGAETLDLKWALSRADDAELLPVVEDDEREAAVTAAQFELIDETEAEAILRWRFEELVRSGYDIGSALVLASHVEVDLHDASSLTQRGCPPETALRILL